MEEIFYKKEKSIKDFILDYRTLSKFQKYYISKKNNNFNSIIKNYKNYNNIASSLNKKKLNNNIVKNIIESKKVSRTLFIKINQEEIYNEKKKNNHEIINKLNNLLNHYNNSNEKINKDFISIIKYTLRKEFTENINISILFHTIYPIYPILNFEDFINENNNKYEPMFITTDINSPIYININISKSSIKEVIEYENILYFYVINIYFNIGTIKTTININYLTDQVIIESKISMSENIKLILDILNNKITFPKEIFSSFFNKEIRENIFLLKGIKEIIVTVKNNDTLFNILNILLNNSYSLFYQIKETFPLKEKIDLLFNYYFYSKKNIISLNDEYNNKFYIDEIYLGDEIKIADIIILDIDKKQSIYLKWNKNLNRNYSFLNFKQNHNKLPLKSKPNIISINSIKKETLSKIINIIYNSLKINSKNILLFYFFNEIIITYEVYKFNIDFLNLITSNFNKFEKIINLDVNIYSKIIAIYQLIRIYNFDFLEKSNQKNILSESLKKILYQYSIKPKNNSFLNKSDFLIISYNEDRKEFKDNDCISILFKIILEEPSILILCTQESTSNKNYTSIFKKIIENWNYIPMDTLQENSSIKTSFYVHYDSFWIPKPDKYIHKIQMASYFIRNKNSILFKEVKENNLDKKKYKYQYFLDKKNIIFPNEIRDKFILKKYSFQLSKNLDALGLELILEKEKEYKFIIINSKLFYKIDKNTGLERREKEFFEIIEEFNLLEFFNKGYNIFFCGDLNFNLYNIVNSNKLIISEDIVNNYLTLNKEIFSLKYKKKDELIKIIKKRNINDLLDSFLISIDKIGYDLTCKYQSSNNELENKNDKKNFNIVTKNINFRVPSMCDRIFFALQDEFQINYSNFNMYYIPKKSYHKIITLSFDL